MSVMVLLVYRMTEELSSLMSVIQLMIAPESTPGSIMGIVTRRNVLSCDAPRLMDASSTLGLICPMMAVLERIVYGMRRMESDMTMMSTVPPSMNGGPLKAYRNEMPSTEPGVVLSVPPIVPIAVRQAPASTIFFAIVFSSLLIPG